MPQDPPITDSMRAYAQENPNTWLYLVDPAYQEEHNPPEHAMIGAYHVRSDGSLDEQFYANDAYRPSTLASAAELEPRTGLERALQLIATGEVPEDVLPAAVLADEVLLYAESWQDEAVYSAEMSDESHLVPACTSTVRVPADWPAYRVVPGTQLPALLDGRDLGLNLDDPIQAIIGHRLLDQAAQATGGAEATGAG